MTERVATLVVGGGVSGLAYAHARGPAAELVLLEAREHPGGLVRTEPLGPRGELCHELGPEALRSEPHGGASELLAELRLASHEPPARARRRLLVRRGELLEVPLGPRLFASPLLGARAKLRLLSEPFRARGVALDGSIADFARHRLGARALEALVDPLVSGIHAGDPEQLSMRACFPRLVELVERHGSLFKGLRASRGAPAPGLVKPAGGCQALPDALARALGERLRCNAAVLALERAGGRWSVQSGAGSFETERLVLALPSATTSRLLATVAPELARVIGGIVAESLVSLTHVWRREDARHGLDAFGYLVPAREGLRHLGTLFSSSIEPASSPPTHVVLRTLLGGARRPELVDRTDEELVGIVRAEVAPLLGLRGEPELVAVRRWRAALPRFELQHGARASAIERSCPPGLTLLGNWLRGIGVNHLIAAARERARADATLDAQPRERA